MITYKYLYIIIIQNPGWTIGLLHPPPSGEGGYIPPCLTPLIGGEGGGEEVTGNGQIDG